MTKDEQQVLELIFAHNKFHIRDFLATCGLTKSGTEEELFAKMAGLLKSKSINLEDLVRLLNQIEGWGDQQIYLYKAVSKEFRQLFADKKKFEGLLADNRMKNLLNAERSIILPDERTLATIEYDEKRVKFIWIEKRIWEERHEDKDKESGGFHFKAYKTHVKRGIMSYDLDLKSGLGVMMIQKLPNNSNSEYVNIRHKLEKELESIIDLDDVPLLKFKKGIKEIHKSGEARSRQVEDQTNLGSRAKYTSMNRKSDIDKDPIIKRARTATSANSQPYMGNFYWDPLKSEGALQSELHSVLHTKDNRVGIYGERTEEEVRYIIERIRFHAQ